MNIIEGETPLPTCAQPTEWTPEDKTMLASVIEELRLKLQVPSGEAENTGFNSNIPWDEVAKKFTSKTPLECNRAYLELNKCEDDGYARRKLSFFSPCIVVKATSKTTDNGIPHLDGNLKNSPETLLLTSEISSSLNYNAVLDQLRIRLLRI